MKNLLKNSLLIFLIATLTGLFGAVNASANTVDELKSKIEEKGGEIEKLEKEIDKYTREIIEVQAESKTLSGSIRELGLTRKKLLTDIDVTNTNIESTNYTLQKIQTEINATTHKINDGNETIGHIMRNIDELETKSLVEVILENDELSNFWNDIESMQKFRDVISENLKELKDLKVDLQNKKAKNKQEKNTLLVFESQLQDQKQIVEINKKDKSYLLSQTENKESNYQKILAERKLTRQKLETELREFEAQLKYTSDKSALPKKGSEVLIFPVKNPRITQRFGLTPFALTGAYGYNKDGKPNPHRGVDFGLQIGTPLLAVASGVVNATENMDAYSGCVSYGKWILIDHNNGLSSLYAHLSLIKVKPGQIVKTGDLVGYSGNSGYSTGPHLHFGVFDKSAVKVGLYSWSNGCKKAKIAYAPYEAYLNPMDYFPKY